MRPLYQNKTCSPLSERTERVTLCRDARSVRPLCQSDTSTEEFGNIYGANENSPPRGGIKLRKNEIKLRKKQIKVPKNFPIPRWRFRNPSEEISDFLKGEASELSEASEPSAGDARVTVVGTHDLCVRCVKSYGIRWIKSYGIRGFNGDGRTDRASLQRATRLVRPLCQRLVRVTPASEPLYLPLAWHWCAALRGKLCRGLDLQSASAT